MNAQELIRSKRQEILRIAAKHGVKRIAVFGSVVRNDARDDSDIDFLVETGPRTSPWFPAGFVLDLEELLGRKVDVVTEKALHWYIRDCVLSEASSLGCVSDGFVL